MRGAGAPAPLHWEEGMEMWRVYVEAGGQPGILVYDCAEEATAWKALMESLDAFLAKGFHLTHRVFPRSPEQFVTWFGLEREGSVALVALCREEHHGN